MMRMQRQFWNDEKTGKSLDVLRRLPKGLDFVLIGGWAVYSYVSAQKSEGVDIAIGLGKLDFFTEYGIEEYEGTTIKHSTINGTVVDLFVEGYTDRDLPVPVSRIMRDYVLIEGLKVVRKELLLLLKLWGYFGHDETKIRKDIIDVATLVFYANIDFGKFSSYIDEYKVPQRRGSDALLKYLDKSETLWEYISPTKKEFDALKKNYKKDIRKFLGYR